MVDRREWVPDKAVEELTVRRALQKLESPTELAKDILKDVLPLATMSMVHLAIHSPTESIRFNASKYIMDKSLGDGKDLRLPDNRPAWEKIYDSVLEEVDAIVNKDE